MRDAVGYRLAHGFKSKKEELRRKDYKQEFLSRVSNYAKTPTKAKCIHCNCMLLRKFCVVLFTYSKYVMAETNFEKKG